MDFKKLLGTVANNPILKSVAAVLAAAIIEGLDTGVTQVLSLPSLGPYREVLAGSVGLLVHNYLSTVRLNILKTDIVAGSVQPPVGS